MKLRKIFIAIMPIIFFSCTNQIEDDMYDNMRTPKESIHPLIDNHYVSYIGDQYVITISKEEALEIGVSREEYEQLDSALTEGNRFLKTIIEDCKRSSKSVTTKSFQYEDIVMGDFIIKTRSEPAGDQLPNGTLESFGQETVSVGLDLPITMKSVICNCYSRAALFPLQIVTTKSFGDTQVGSKVGQSVTIQVNFSANNTVGGITYCTSDSNGGLCAWKGSSGRV